VVVGRCVGGTRTIRRPVFQQGLLCGASESAKEGTTGEGKGVNQGLGVHAVGWPQTQAHGERARKESVPVAGAVEVDEGVEVVEVEGKGVGDKGGMGARRALNCCSIKSTHTFTLN
jgi:hypothetical protein